MQAWMGQRCQPGKEPVISASQRETLQIQKRNAALRQEWIGNSSAAGGRKDRSVTDFSAGEITLEQINLMNFPAVNQKEDRLGKGTVPTVVLLIAVVEEKAGVFSRLESGKKSWQLRIAGI